MSALPSVPGSARPTMGCRAREVLDRVGDKWSLLVIGLLGDGTRPRRFTDLRRRTDGISQRMLTVTLRGLERDGLVIRTVHPTIPPRVDYALTPMGRTLLDTVRALLDWADEHLPEIDAARAAYDRRAALLAASLNSSPESASESAPDGPAEADQQGKVETERVRPSPSGTNVGRLTYRVRRSS